MYTMMTGDRSGVPALGKGITRTPPAVSCVESRSMLSGLPHLRLALQAGLGQPVRSLVQLMPVVAAHPIAM